MPGSLSNEYETKLLNHVLKVNAHTQLTELYIGLGTAASDTSFTEITGNGYSRVMANAWDVASSRATQNTNPISGWTATGAGWGSVTHFGVFEAVSGGIRIGQGQLAQSVPVGAGDSPTFPAGAFDVQIPTGGMTNNLAHKFLDHVFLNTAFAVPVNLYAILSITTLSDSTIGFGSFTEPGGGGYMRANVSSSVWAAAVNGLSNNLLAIAFGPAGGTWNLVGFGIANAGTAGELLMYKNFSPGVTVIPGRIAEFAIGAFTLTMD